MYRIKIMKYATLLEESSVNHFPEFVTCPSCGTERKITNREIKNEGYTCGGYPAGVRKQDYNWCIVSVIITKE